MKKERKQIEGWIYYNHAIIPTTAPDEPINLTPLEKGDVWNIPGETPLLVRYHTDWDCKEKTEWWYVIKDTPFDINNLKSKRRYEINKGNKNFCVKIINPLDYASDLFEVTLEAYKGWPLKYRPNLIKEQFLENIKKYNNDEKNVFYGAFDVTNMSLCGYAILTCYKSYIDFSVLRTKPESEKKGVNFSIVYKMLIDFNEKLCEGYYICDGQRAILHETYFQDFLEKYFEFRKSYCKLCVKYRFCLNFIIRILKPFKRFFNPDMKLFCKLNALILLDDISLKCKNRRI